MNAMHTNLAVYWVCIKKQFQSYLTAGFCCNITCIVVFTSLNNIVCLSWEVDGIVGILCPKIYWNTLFDTNEENNCVACDSYANIEGINKKLF
jgi:hypothetical protein